MTVGEAGKIGGRVRGKQIQGKRNPNAKLTPGDVEEIKDAKGKVHAEALGLLYNVHPEHVRRLWRGEHWNG